MYSKTANKPLPHTLQAVLLLDGSLQLEDDTKNRKQTKSSTLLQHHLMLKTLLLPLLVLEKLQQLLDV